MVIYSYDGNVWKELQDIDGIPFLSVPHNYCFTMNVDWFNPYDRTEYSVGAIIYILLSRIYLILNGINLRM